MIIMDTTAAISVFRRKPNPVWRGETIKRENQCSWRHFLSICRDLVVKSVQECIGGGKGEWLSVEGPNARERNQIPRPDFVVHRDPAKVPKGT
ncbi:hypothetical protein MTP99_014250 [Tenebrio molitor]|nr:hypothetical protein MTP99_014250 [Tenebrio molitor]